MRPCEDGRENHFARKEREERERTEEKRRFDNHMHELRRACLSVAATPEGRFVLAEFVHDDIAAIATMSFAGNSRDAFNLGRAYQALKTREVLKDILPRETYLEIIYPKEEKNHA